MVGQGRDARHGQGYWQSLRQREKNLGPNSFFLRAELVGATRN